MNQLNIVELHLQVETMRISDIKSGGVVSQEVSAVGTLRSGGVASHDSGRVGTLVLPKSSLVEAEAFNAKLVVSSFLWFGSVRWDKLDQTGICLCGLNLSSPSPFLTSISEFHPVSIFTLFKTLCLFSLLLKKMRQDTSWKSDLYEF